MPCCHKRRLPCGPLAAGMQTAADAAVKVPIPNNAACHCKPILAAKRQPRCVLAQMRTSSSLRAHTAIRAVTHCCVVAQMRTANSTRTRISNGDEHTSWEQAGKPSAVISMPRKGLTISALRDFSKVLFRSNPLGANRIRTSGQPTPSRHKCRVPFGPRAAHPQAATEAGNQVPNCVL